MLHVAWFALPVVEQFKSKFYSHSFESVWTEPREDADREGAIGHTVAQFHVWIQLTNSQNVKVNAFFFYDTSYQRYVA